MHLPVGYSLQLKTHARKVHKLSPETTAQVCC